MSRQSISFTSPNDAWLKSHVGADGEYRSNSEAVNDAIRRMRDKENEFNLIRAAMIEGEKSGIAKQTPEEAKTNVLNRLRANGRLPAK